MVYPSLTFFEEEMIKSWPRDHRNAPLIECVEQYTGLHDSKGVEIYEGDILRNEYSGWVASVQWFNSGFWCETYNKTHEMPNEDMRVVIGNIHENTELLDE